MDILRTQARSRWQLQPPAQLRPALVGACALTVLSAAVAAALSMPPTPGTPTAAVDAGVAASDVVAPAPVVLSFPPPPPPPLAVAAPPAAARPRATRPPRPAAAAPTPGRTRGPAPAPPTGSRCSGAGWQQRRGAAALASLRRPADAQAFRVEFLPGRSDVLGLAYLQERRIEIFVRSCTELSDSLLRQVLAHEIGHLVDASRMPATRREEWLRTRGIAPGTPWQGCNACADFATPAGDFAEVYAQWQRGARDNLSELASAPDAAALDQIAARFF